MKVSTTQEILDMSDGDEVQAYKGRIKSVGKVSTGDGKFGEWTRQNLDMQGGLSVVLWSQMKFGREWEGKELYITGDLEVNDYEGKRGTVRQLKVSGENNEFQQADNSGTHSSSPSEPKQADSPAPAKQNAPPGGLATARTYAGKAANLAVLALRAAEHAGKTFEKTAATGTFVTPEILNAIFEAIFSAMMLGGQVANMPSGTMEEKPKLAPKPEPPAPEPKAPVEPKAEPPPAKADDSEDVPF